MSQPEHFGEWTAGLAVPSWPAVDERVILRDPQLPRSMDLHGVVLAVDEHRVTIRWDGMWDHQPPAMVGVDHLDQLHPEAADDRR